MHSQKQGAGRMIEIRKAKLEQIIAMYKAENSCVGDF
jgi:hypothetical protein